MEAFLLDTSNLNGISTTPLVPSGIPGSNLAHLCFDNVFVPDSHRLGAQLKPTERLGRSVLLTFDALRPCVAAAALGVTGSLLDRAEATFPCDAAWLRKARRQLEGARGLLWQCCDDFDLGRGTGRRAGVMKAHAVALAEALALELLHRLPPAAMVEHDWLGKGWRDVKAFEYMEGTSFIHWQNAADLFRKERHVPC
jgi:alkylation response protein AidB-like acyl-CoA dehydrogenase